MARRSIRRIEVLVNETPAGTLEIESDQLSPLEHMSFSYADTWISSAGSFELSPELPLMRGPQHPTLGRMIFGSFQDAAPDAWGRKLLFEELRQQARTKGTGLQNLSEAGYLLMVNDETRQGALRFRENGEFLSSWGKRARIRDLEALAVEARVFAETGYVDEENSMLLGAGSSPGGAQPKAWVRDSDGSMLLAKFPLGSGSGNPQVWEMVAIRLQKRAGIKVQASRLLPLTEHSHIFLTRRFDRSGDLRIPYMSMRSALQLDTYAHPDYVRIAGEIARISGAPVQDANEMFSRAAFGAMVNNTDDHMRNHGLLRTDNGWRLSPSFDVNPMPTGASDTPLVPGGSPYDRDVRDLLEYADAFRLTRDQAIGRLRLVAEAVSHWRNEALSLGLEAELLEHMVRAFEGDNIQRVKSLPPAPTVIDLRDTRRHTLEAAPREEIWIPGHLRRGKPIRGHFRKRRG